MAGFETDVVQLVPRIVCATATAFGANVTGLILRLQTLDLQGRILEQAAFSELQLDAALSASKLLRSGSTEGYRVIRAEMQKTTPEAQGGWCAGKSTDSTGQLLPAPGSECARRSGCHGPAMPVWRWGGHRVTVCRVFDPRRHLREGESNLGGATRSLTRRVQNWWLTAMGEVPSGTLAAFANSMERNR